MLVNNKLTYGIVVASVLTAIIVAIFVSTSMPAEAQYTPITREFYLFNTENEDINETALGIPHDVFSQTQIIVHKGDTVVIHFYNVDKEDHHTFTILDERYKMNHDLKPNDHVDIKFVAEHRGIYEYVCTYHLPTMRGELIVL